ncbi:MAG: tRNA 2-thiocytidine(32) synthetase TtcA [Clostridia bacterium]|nr:tRNA 2-thiocytidine(32) synthetase TtcA [Clostridia bacterium]
MKFNKIRRLLSCTRRCVDDYSMIEDGDKIAVGLSGGKDSCALLCTLHDLKRFYPKKFEVVGITVDLGFEGSDYSETEKFCREIGVEYIIKKTSIAEIIFDIRKESNPCALCAKMRRGVLNETAKEAGCNKVALGHHYDDAIDTFMLNLVHEGRIASFSPVTYLSNVDLTVIRPLSYCPEKDIEYFARQNTLPVSKSLCPEDKHTERESIKQLVDSLDREYEGFKHRIFHAMQKQNVSRWGKNNIFEKRDFPLDTQF